MITSDNRQDRRGSRKRALGAAILTASLAVATVGCSSSTGNNGLDQVPNQPAATNSVSGGSGGALPASVMRCPWKGCAAVKALIATGENIKELPANVTPDLQTAKHDIELPPQFAECAVGNRKTSPDCLIAQPNPAAPKLVLFGDSQAEMWASAVAAIAQRLGYSMMLLAKPGCPSPLIPFWDNSTNTPATVCAQWKQAAIERINQFAPNVVILATVFFQPHDYHRQLISPDAFSAGLVTTLRRIASPGRELAVVGLMPYWSKSGPECLAAHEHELRTCNAPASQAVLTGHDQAVENAAKKAKARYVNIVPWFCTPTVCPQVINNTIVYVDQFHITSTYAKQFEQLLQTALALR